MRYAKVAFYIVGGNIEIRIPDMACSTTTSACQFQNHKPHWHKIKSDNTQIYIFQVFTIFCVEFALTLARDSLRSND